MTELRVVQRWQTVLETESGTKVKKALDYHIEVKVDGEWVRVPTVDVDVDADA